MTRQEVAVARSHVEVWKAVATGSDDHVLVLEDDVWFRRGAAAAIDRGWRAALRRCAPKADRSLLYLSYADAGGTAERDDVCDALFRPARGLWFLSGYVLSREGAAALLRAMPVVGPVDLWINYRFEELGALALSSPAIAAEAGRCLRQRLFRPAVPGAGGDRRCGARGQCRPTGRAPAQFWRGLPARERESLAMALSMLGLRVRAFDGDEEAIARTGPDEPLRRRSTPSLTLHSRRTPYPPRLQRSATRFLLEANATLCSGIEAARVPPSRIAVLSPDDSGPDRGSRSAPFLGLPSPFRPSLSELREAVRIFRDDRPNATCRFCPRLTAEGLFAGRLALGPATRVVGSRGLPRVSLHALAGTAPRPRDDDDGDGFVPWPRRDLSGQSGIVRTGKSGARSKRRASRRQQGRRWKQAVPFRRLRIRALL